MVSTSIILVSAMPVTPEDKDGSTLVSASSSSSSKKYNDKDETAKIMSVIEAIGYWKEKSTQTEQQWPQTGQRKILGSIQAMLYN